MLAFGPPIKNINELVWKIVDFKIAEDHLNPFITFMDSQLTNKKPEDLVFKADKVACTLDTIDISPIPGSSIYKMVPIVVQFGGYEIFKGKAINIPDMIVFTIRPTNLGYYDVSGSGKLIFWDFFSSILIEISQRFVETSEAINQYFIRQKLIIKSIKDSNKQGINLAPYPENIIGKKSTERKNKPRYDARKRVAVALYNIKQGIVLSRSQAAKRYHTHVDTINNYEFDPYVIELLRRFDENPETATKMRQEIMKK